MNKLKLLLKVGTGDDMKVEVDVKITVLDGEEAGRIFTQKTVGETKPRYTEYGIIENLRLEWNYVHNYTEESKSNLAADEIAKMIAEW